MNKNMTKLIATLISITFFSTAQGSVISDAGSVNEYLLPGQAYTLPNGYSTIASQAIDLDHYYAYKWSLNDLNSIASNDTLQIVFHGIYNGVDNELDNILNVYIKDGLVNGNTVFDAESGTYPDWTGWTHLGSWTYVDFDMSNVWPDSRYDVVFILDMSPEWVEYLTNGNGFTIGIDPDCHYYGDRIEVNAPVPEPATLILLGSGLLGLAAFRRKGNN